MTDELGTLRMIRSRRLDKATAFRQSCDSKLAIAHQAKQDATETFRKTEVSGWQRIEGMYNKLLTAGTCTVKDLDDVKFTEAQLRERLAQLAKAEKDAAAAVEEAATELAKARQQVVSMSAALEAIDLLDTEQAAEQLIKDARAEDEIIDEVALRSNSG